MIKRNAAITQKNTRTKKMAQHLQHFLRYHSSLDPPLFLLVFLFLVGKLSCVVPTNEFAESVIPSLMTVSECVVLLVDRFVCVDLPSSGEVSMISICPFAYSKSWSLCFRPMRQEGHSGRPHSNSKQNISNGKLWISHISASKWISVVSIGGADGWTDSSADPTKDSQTVCSRVPSNFAFLSASSMFSRTYRFVGKAWAPPDGTWWHSRHSGHCTRSSTASFLKQWRQIVWLQGRSFGHLSPCHT